MITHVVLFKLKEPTPENVRFLAELLRGMKGQIPELLEIEVGIDELRTERSYDVALRTRHASFEDLDRYQAHPAHEKVKEGMLPLLARSYAVDYSSP